ncbi:MAG: hypothetical protein CVV64_11225 [Candidatus Wallbacteria bacterium HGW-Wallbacteria-1]|jgi:CheY-like chemotaxis protein|uniref:histidine kinase n=1 Tax=Candidatus Wallbacteria bacterium HGW-Wallbacteria-1 TaxID=2013854 RepID=A0A2N1PP81_9BACT|nr:MAG: hypothetical protein CVV64_11225 [Candidatus Wallbacteria bacterium HGW-Wallbacteria-1]
MSDSSNDQLNAEYDMRRYSDDDFRESDFDSGAEKSILIVEDEAVIAMHLEERLSAMGYNVVGVATSGDQAIEFSMKLSPDIILMDIVMPGTIDGIDAASRIQEDYGIPVIFVTGFAGKKFLARATRALAYGYIVKPFQDKQIRASIELSLYRSEVEKSNNIRLFRSKPTVLSLERKVESNSSDKIEKNSVEEHSRGNETRIFFFNSSRIGMIALDKSGRILAANPAASDILLDCNGDPTGWIFSSFIPEKSVTAFERSSARLLDGISESETIVVSDHSGRIKKFLNLDMARLDIGGDIGLAVLITDVTDEYQKGTLESLKTEILGILNDSSYEFGIYDVIMRRIATAFELNASFLMMMSDSGLRTIGRWCDDGVDSTILEPICGACSRICIDCSCRRIAEGSEDRSAGTHLVLNTRNSMDQLRESLLAGKNSDAFLPCLSIRQCNSIALIPVRGPGGSRAVLRLMSENEETFGTFVIEYLKELGRAIAATLDRALSEEQNRMISRIESLGILAGGIAHDFNNVLTVIMGNLSMSEDLFREMENSSSAASGKSDFNSGELLVCLEEARSATMRAATMASQLLTFSKGGEPVRKPVDIRNVIERAMAFSTHGSRVIWETDIPASIWRVLGDKNQLVQVVNILAINSIQAMGEKGGKIRIQASAVHGQPREVAVRLGRSIAKSVNRYVKIQFSDTGPGIDPGSEGKIFDPYFTTREFSSGLGLAAAESIMQRHGGVLCLDNSMRRNSDFRSMGALSGACFKLFLPAWNGSDVKHETLPAVGEGLDETHRILIMDDEEAVLDIAARILERTGCTVHKAFNGEQVLEMYVNALRLGETYDVVILDLTIPGGLGGRDTIRKLIEVDPHVQAIVSSGYSDDPVMANYRSYGFNGIIEKPYSAGKLRTTVDDFLRKGKPMAEKSLKSDQDPDREDNHEK